MVKNLPASAGDTRDMGSPGSGRSRDMGSRDMGSLGQEDPLEEGMATNSSILVCAQSFLTLCDPMDCVACLAPLSMEFTSQEYWSRLPCPPPGDLPNPGTEPASHTSTLVGRFFTTSATWEAISYAYIIINM